MKDGKVIYSLHIHVDLFTVLFHPTRPCCIDLRQVAKFYRFKLMQLGTDTPNLLPVLFSFHLIAFYDSAVVYAACLIC